MKRYVVADDAGLLRDYVAGIVRDGGRVVNIICQPTMSLPAGAPKGRPGSAYVVIAESDGQGTKH